MSSAARAAGIVRHLWLAAALGLLLPDAGQAQLGGLRRLKEKVEAATSEKPAAEQPQERSPYNESTLELTAKVAECFERALATENAELEAFRQWAATVKSEEEHQACQLQAMMSPEGQKLTAEYTASLEGKEGQALLAAMQVHSQKLEALVDKACGPRPSALEQRRRDAQKAAGEKARAECGYTERQYAVLKERLVPICGTPALAGADGAVRIPGSGTNIFWVYSAAEVEVLKQRCGSLQAAMKKLQ